MELAEKDPDIIHLLADSGTGYDEMFKRNFPNQMYNFGIGEENMVATAKRYGFSWEKTVCFYSRCISGL